jgi:arylsulfatase A-like enzyme
MTWFDRRSTGGFLLLGLATVAAIAGGCSRQRSGFVLRDAVARGAYGVGAAGTSGAEGLTFPVKPEITDLALSYERRPVVLTNLSFRWRGRIPKGATLHAGVQLIPAAWRTLRRFEAKVVVRDGREREVLAVGRSQAGEARWVDLEGDLSPYAGRTVTLEFSVAVPDRLPPQHRRSNLAAWGPVSVTSYARRERPNVLFILVDTLRYDHLASYGYRREVTPEITRLLGEPGAVVEDAYSQAPWTLPSVVSFMISRHPGEVLGEDLAAYGIPDKIEPLAQHMAKLGYATGGFIANPSLHAGAGFERGFSTFFAPPADIDWMNRHADDLNSHAVPWLRANQDRPFFAYVHYIDPHDPYSNPDMIGGRSQFDPGYKGPIAGDWIHGIYAGNLQMTDPERDVAYIKAMYDSEVHYVDRYVGLLLESLKPEVLENTLVVLTADHGEELYDHGGWKHGQTLYEEQIHVPLLVRWDGRIPAGRRVAGTVRLLDLLPTLSAAVGGKADPAWEGIDLLPALTAKGPLPKRPAFAQHLATGPLRAAAVLDREKLIFFNPQEPFQPVDELQDFLWKKDLGRMKRYEVYDLKADPGERQNLAEAHPERVSRLEPVIDRRLDPVLSGLRVFAQGLKPGQRLTGTVTFAAPPTAAIPFFLGAGDRAELSGSILRFELTGEAAPEVKGVRIAGDFGAVLSIEAALDGKPLPPAALRTGAGAAYAGGTVAKGALESPGWPAAGRGSALLLWLHRSDRPGERRTHADPETERRLKALGYL